jgi:hypothetical protein
LSGVPHFLYPVQTITCVEASIEILLILHKPEENNFEGIATGDESWFQYSYPSSKMFARSPTDVIPRTHKAIGTKKVMRTVFFTARTPIVFDTLSKGSEFNQLYLVDSIFPDLQREKANFHHRIPQAIFCAYINNFMCHNGSKVASKFEKHYVSRSLHPPHSLAISPCDF